MLSSKDLLELPHEIKTRDVKNIIREAVIIILMKVSFHPKPFDQ